MIRSGVVLGWMVAVVFTAGCSGDRNSQSRSSPPKDTPSMPVTTEVTPDSKAGTPESSASPEAGGAEAGGAAKEVKSVELIDATWADLQTLIAEQKGKIVVVDVWSTACEPCMAEFPHLISLQQRFPNDVVAISFDVDYAGIKNKPPAYYRERVLNFLGSQNENQVLHRMCTTAAEDLFDEIKLDSIPAVYVYGRDGELLKRFTGSTNGSEGVSYEKQVLPYVGDQIK